MCLARPLDTALERTVMIIVFDEQSQPISIGSGFIVGKNGQIATNYHVVEGGSSAVVKLQNSDSFHEVLKLTHKSPERDIAVIQIDQESLPLDLIDDTSILVGQSIYAIGNPEGLEGTLSKGIVSGFRKIEPDFRLMQITAPISPGSSGGPVITEEGYVIGIATATFISGQNLNFAIPSSELKKLLKTPSLEEDFTQDILKSSAEAFLETESSKDLVTFSNFRIAQRYHGGRANISFSVRNDGRRDISNLRVVLIWKDLQGKERHFSPIQISERIPSGMTKSISKTLQQVGNIFVSVDDRNVKVRILDYEVLETSGRIDFE